MSSHAENDEYKSENDFRQINGALESLVANQVSSNTLLLEALSRIVVEYTRCQECFQVTDSCVCCRESSKNDCICCGECYKEVCVCCQGCLRDVCICDEDYRTDEEHERNCGCDMCYYAECAWEDRFEERLRRHRYKD